MRVSRLRHAVLCPSLMHVTLLCLKKGAISRRSIQCSQWTCDRMSVRGTMNKPSFTKSISPRHKPSIPFSGQYGALYQNRVRAGASHPHVNSRVHHRPNHPTPHLISPCVTDSIQILSIASISRLNRPFATLRSWLSIFNPRSCLFCKRSEWTSAQRSRMSFFCRSR